MAGLFDVLIGFVVDDLLALVTYGVIGGLIGIDRRDGLVVGHRIMMNGLISNRPIVRAGVFLRAIVFVRICGRRRFDGSLLTRRLLPSGRTTCVRQEDRDRREKGKKGNDRSDGD